MPQYKSVSDRQDLNEEQKEVARNKIRKLRKDLLAQDETTLTLEQRVARLEIFIRG